MYSQVLTKETGRCDRPANRGVLVQRLPQHNGWFKRTIVRPLLRLCQGLADARPPHAEGVCRRSCSLQPISVADSTYLQNKLTRKYSRSPQTSTSSVPIAAVTAALPSNCHKNPVSLCVKNIIVHHAPHLTAPHAPHLTEFLAMPSQWWTRWRSYNDKSKCSHFCLSRVCRRFSFPPPPFLSHPSFVFSSFYPPSFPSFQKI